MTRIRISRTLIMVVFLVALVFTGVRGLPLLYDRLNRTTVTDTSSGEIETYQVRRWPPGAGDLHGSYEVRRSDGSLRQRGTFARDQEHGLWEHWDTAGHLTREVMWEDGRITEQRSDPPWFGDHPRETVAAYRESARRCEQRCQDDPEDAVSHGKLPHYWRRVAQFERLAGNSKGEREAWEQALLGYRVNATFALSSLSDLNNCAWYLLVCPVEDLRDPQMARTLASKAVTLGEESDGNHLDTLALAYYQTGDIARAIATQRKALAVLMVDHPAREDVEARLVKYMDAERGVVRE